MQEEVWKILKDLFQNRVTLYSVTVLSKILICTRIENKNVILHSKECNIFILEILDVSFSITTDYQLDNPSSIPV
jgi:hypothetical protein